MTETTNVNNNIDFASTLKSIKEMLVEFKGQEMSQTDMDELVQKLVTKVTAEELEQGLVERSTMYKDLITELQEANAELIAKLGDNTLKLERNRVDLELKADEINALEASLKETKKEVARLETEVKDQKATIVSKNDALTEQKETIESLEAQAITDGKKLERRVREEVAKIEAEHEIALTEERLNTAEATAKYDTLKGKLTALKISDF